MSGIDLRMDAAMFSVAGKRNYSQTQEKSPTEAGLVGQAGGIVLNNEVGSDSRPLAYVFSACQHISADAQSHLSSNSVFLPDEIPRERAPVAYHSVDFKVTVGLRLCDRALVVCRRTSSFAFGLLLTHPPNRRL